MNNFRNQDVYKKFNISECSKISASSSFASFSCMFKENYLQLLKNPFKQQVTKFVAIFNPINLTYTQYKHIFIGINLLYNWIIEKSKLKIQRLTSLFLIQIIYDTLKVYIYKGDWFPFFFFPSICEKIYFHIFGVEGFVECHCYIVYNFFNPPPLNWGKNHCFMSILLRNFQILYIIENTAFFHSFDSFRDPSQRSYEMRQN